MHPTPSDLHIFSSHSCQVLRHLEMKTSHIAVYAMLLLLLVAEAQVSTAATCNPTALSPCLGAITSSNKPSPLCCSRIKQQKPCLCTYLKNPNLKKFVNSPGSRKVSSYCRVPVPKC
ncbi:hypothetical protein Leryth_011972 [Lithospermum erythrorhizon]|nr:hypothetical protein Leryth_011972 [Lithospermum erythrorhizon]